MSGQSLLINCWPNLTSRKRNTKAIFVILIFLSSDMLRHRGWVLSLGLFDVQQQFCILSQTKLEENSSVPIYYNG